MTSRPVAGTTAGAVPLTTKTVSVQRTGSEAGLADLPRVPRLGQSALHRADAVDLEQARQVGARALERRARHVGVVDNMTTSPGAPPLGPGLNVGRSGC